MEDHPVVAEAGIKASEEETTATIAIMKASPLLIFISSF
jgi:hypothetical protein